MTTADVKVTTYTPGSSSTTLHTIWEAGFAALHKPYSLPASKLNSFLNADNAVVFVAADPSTNDPLGFALTTSERKGSEPNPTTQHLGGQLVALVVHPSHQGQGIGSALHAAALEHLTKLVRSSFGNSTPPAKSSTLQLGSEFPRIFPGLPALDVYKPARAFFEKRGWTFKEHTPIDLYSTLPTGVDQEQFQKQAHEHGVTFRRAKESDRDELMKMEYEYFNAFAGWPDMFPKLLDHNPDNILLSICKQGRIIGATVSALAPSPIHDVLAWPVTLGKNCGAVACVGVSPAARGTGAGVGMCAAALEDLEKRGADGCFIDWVGMVGFYERFGMKKWEAAYWESFRTVE